MSIKVKEIKVKSILTKTNVPIGDYAVNPYVGCAHGCKYCYANYSRTSVEAAFEKHDPRSPLLIGDIGPNDKITERKVKSITESQISLF